MNWPEPKKVWTAAILYWIVFGLLCTLLYPATIFDTMARYAPMADAFARGDWELAFHPRFGVLFEVLCGGLSWLTGLPGNLSVQVVSVGFLALSGVPLWFAVRQVFDVRIAWWALVFLFLSDDLTRYAMDGLRDTGKCLAFALLGYGCVARRPLWYACGLFVLVTLVSYGFAVATVLLPVWAVWIFSCGGRESRPRLLASLGLPLLGWSLGTLAVTALTHAYTGHWLPTSHFIRFLGRWL